MLLTAAPWLLLSSILVIPTFAQSYAPSISACPPNSTVRLAGTPSANNQTLNPYAPSSVAPLPHSGNLFTFFLGMIDRSWRISRRDGLLCPLLLLLILEGTLRLFMVEMSPI